MVQRPLMNMSMEELALFNIVMLVNKAGSKTLTHSFNYGKDDLLFTYVMSSGKTVNYTYDTLNRLQGYEIGSITPITVDYSYFLSNRNAIVDMEGTTVGSCR